MICQVETKVPDCLNGYSSLYNTFVKVYTMSSKGVKQM